MAVPLARCAQAAPDDSLLDALERPGVTMPPRILVLDAGQLVGIVTGHDISRIAQQSAPSPHTTRVRPIG